MTSKILDSANPTPRDFSEFIYCGMRWILEKNVSNVNDRRLSEQCYEISEQAIALKTGQNNESKCIKWVLSHLRLSDSNIVFDGTGTNSKYLISKNGLGNPIMKCKPDLIISDGDKTILFEFKAVKTDNYLKLFEFKSNYAQIWCYSKIVDFTINRYYLLRYYIDPFMKLQPFNRPAYDLKEITFSNDEELYFSLSFTKYLEFIKMYNAKDSNLINVLLEFYTPITKADKSKKCSNCYYNKKNICNKIEWELQKELEIK